MKRFSYVATAFIMAMILVSGVSCKEDMPVPPSDDGDVSSVKLSENLEDTVWRSLDYELLGVDANCISFDSNGLPEGAPSEEVKILKDTATEYSLSVPAPGENIVEIFTFKVGETPGLLKATKTQGNESLESDLYLDSSPAWISNGSYFVVHDSLGQLDFDAEGRFVPRVSYGDVVRTVTISFDEDNAIYGYKIYSKPDDESPYEVSGNGYLKVGNNEGKLSFSFLPDIGGTPSALTSVALKDLPSLAEPATPIAFPDWIKNLTLYEKDPDFGKTYFFDSQGQCVIEGVKLDTTVISSAPDHLVLQSGNFEFEEGHYIGIYPLDDEGNSYVFQDYLYLDGEACEDCTSIIYRYDNSRLANTVWQKKSSSYYIFFDGDGIMHFHDYINNYWDIYSYTEDVDLKKGHYLCTYSCVSSINGQDLVRNRFPYEPGPEIEISTFDTVDGATFYDKANIRKNEIPENLKNLELVSKDQEFSKLGTDTISFDENGRMNIADQDDLYWYDKGKTDKFTCYIRKVTDGSAEGIINEYEFDFNLGKITFTSKDSTGEISNWTDRFIETVNPPEALKNTSWKSAADDTLTFDSDGYLEYTEPEKVFRCTCQIYESGYLFLFDYFGGSGDLQQIDYLVQVESDHIIVSSDYFLLDPVEYTKDTI